MNRQPLFKNGGLQPEPCLKGFEHVNRFYDKTRKIFVAKILPGEVYVSRNAELIATTLGSCVSACIWDVNAGIGGMNHFMLPLTEKSSDEVVWGKSISDATRYGNFAMESLINEVLKNGGSRIHLRAKVFGGGRIIRNMSNVGEKNARFVIEYLQMENIPVAAQDLGKNYPRKIIFNPLDGAAMMKQVQKLNNETIITREETYKTQIDHPVDGGDVELF